MRASTRAYRELLDEIIRGDLPPGAVLAEVDLADRLGMSRTPVREALSRLVADGLVVAVGGRGLEVAAMDLEDVRSLYELREALESQAARLAARRARPEVFAALAEEFAAMPATLDSADTDDPDRTAYYELIARFDAAIDEAIGNDFLLSALRSARTHAARVRRAAQSNPARLIAAAGEHALIARAIASGDADLAVHATCIHLHNSLANALAAAAAVRSVAATADTPPRAGTPYAPASETVHPQAPALAAH